eukprot:793355-Pyramimonas_sp.AAC.1
MRAGTVQIPLPFNLRSHVMSRPTGAVKGMVIEERNVAEYMSDDPMIMRTCEVKRAGARGFHENDTFYFCCRSDTYEGRFLKVVGKARFARQSTCAVGALKDLGMK